MNEINPSNNALYNKRDSLKIHLMLQKSFNSFFKILKIISKIYQISNHFIKRKKTFNYYEVLLFFQTHHVNSLTFYLIFKKLCLTCLTICMIVFLKEIISTLNNNFTKRF